MSFGVCLSMLKHVCVLAFEHSGFHKHTNYGCFFCTAGTTAVQSGDHVVVDLSAAVCLQHLPR